MNKVFISLFLFALGILFGPAAIRAQQAGTITYEITARNLSPEAVGSYPQKILHIQREDSLYRAVVRTFAVCNDSVEWGKILGAPYEKERSYPEEIEKYLHPTSLTNYRIREIGEVVDSVQRNGGKRTIDIIQSLLHYTSGRIEYDNELAIQLDRGECVTLPVEDILRRGKGTCSEYTNLFLALARKAGIPSRMVIGYIYMPDNNYEGSHAWAECYLPDCGWFAVDPQNGFYRFPAAAVKLFTGTDFRDCGIGTLPDMYPIKVRILKNE